MHQVAEHAIGLLFAVIRQIVAQDRLVRQGTWDRVPGLARLAPGRPDARPVGFGRIARLVARKAPGWS